MIEYQKRNNDLHYYFVYLSDYANSYEAWSENSEELERRNETRVINMVFRKISNKIKALNIYKFADRIDALRDYMFNPVDEEVNEEN